ncbi:molybdopterin-guanine dinucleotide biosynthesis protein MobB [Cupriavidus necator]|uniref:Molybdopterin-guanine dinucleotide biosynthesis protein MobB n=1 Tax=Cupriavidus necator TaxID=106590 RepID=A0A1U9V137_CUPNE|nr:DUF2889 domain-containing protein [Cupriavidus necator]AQV98676.1 molybdopterin-guanine dinucleotide biosynthesis protein MobB [Cupriavidus necator]
MPPDTPSRQPIHVRRIACTGYERSDGLFDIEGEMQDISPTCTDLLFKLVPPGGAIHHMRIVLTVDRDLLIHDVSASIEAGPTVGCADIAPAYAGLKGLQIRAGFRQKAKAIVGGVNGCTHLTELLGPLATTAMQTTMAVMRRERSGRKLGQPGQPGKPVPRPMLINSCHTYREDGETAKLLWPEGRATAPASQGG